MPPFRRRTTFSSATSRRERRKAARLRTSTESSKSTRQGSIRSMLARVGPTFAPLQPAEGTTMDPGAHSRLVLGLGRLSPLWDDPLYATRDSAHVNTVGKPDEGKPHVRFDEGRLARSAGPVACSTQVLPPRVRRSWHPIHPSGQLSLTPNWWRGAVERPSMVQVSSARQTPSPNHDAGEPGQAQEHEDRQR